MTAGGAADVLVVGTGLIGTSIGLALHGQADVLLHDRDPDLLARAVRRGAGRAAGPADRARLVVLAVPPSAVPGEWQRLRADHPDAAWTHVSSVQSQVQAEVESTGADVSRFCGSHPMAGRERSGPDAAVADLFRDRPWVLCPGAGTDPDVVRTVRHLATACGAEPVQTTPEEHDAAVALVSHLPQVAASAVAAQLVGAAGEAVRLSGPGLQDTTRIAASAPELWVELLLRNGPLVAPLVRRLARDLTRVAEALDGPPAEATAAVRDLLRRGNDGRALVPVKRGEHDRDFVVVPVSVPDEPGQLAGVLVSAAESGVNVEDVRVEHLPGSPRGVIELLVHSSSAAQARLALAAAGWRVVGG